MNIRQAKSLRPRQIVHYTGELDNCTSEPTKGKKLKVTRFRVSGQPKTWKTDPNRIRVPVKFGLNYSTAITEDNLHEWHHETECPLLIKPLTEDDDNQEVLVDIDPPLMYEDFEVML